MKCMKLIFLSALVLMLFGCSTDKANKPEEAVATKDYGPFKIKRGTNIAHWLSQSNRRGSERASFFTQKDVQFIASSGFDHFRLPVDEEQLWDSAGKRYDDAFQLLENALSWAS